MTQRTCECKSNPVDIARATEGTPTAKLIAILVAHGVTDAADLAAIVGISERGVRKARNYRAGTQVPRGTAGPELQGRGGTTVPQTELQGRNSSSALARAYKESLRDKSNITSEDIDLASSQSDELPAPARPAPAKPDAARGSRLPEGWTLPDEWRQWAEINTQLGRAGIAAEAEKFRDYWHAQPGMRGRKVSWLATWRNWCRNVRAARPYSAAQLAWDERNARLRAEGKPTTLREALRLRAAEAAALEATA